MCYPGVVAMSNEKVIRPFIYWHANLFICHVYGNYKYIQILFFSKVRPPFLFICSLWGRSPCYCMSTGRNNIRNTQYLLSVSSSTKLKLKLGWVENKVWRWYVCSCSVLLSLSACLLGDRQTCQDGTPLQHNLNLFMNLIAHNIKRDCRTRWIWLGLNRGRGHFKIFFRCSNDFIAQKSYISRLMRVLFSLFVSFSLMKSGGIIVHW